MTCQKSKGKKSRSLVRGPRSAVVDPDFYSSAIEVDNYDQDQDGCKLTDVFQADPVLQACATFKEMKKGCGKRSPTSALFTSTGSSDHHPYEEAVLINSALLFNQEVPGGPSPSHQLSGSEKAPRNVDWMEQAESQTVISRDEGPASPYYGCDSSVFGHEASAVLRVANHPKQGDEFLQANDSFVWWRRKRPRWWKISARLSAMQMSPNSLCVRECMDWV